MRIWVARPEPEATRTARRVAELGHVPLVAPVLALARTDAAAPPGPFDAVLLTSVAGARILAKTDGLAGIPVFAVGARTAEHARAPHGAAPRVADGDARALAALVGASLPPGARLLHVAGEDRKAEPAASLRAAGFDLAVWAAYAAHAVEALPAPVAAALSGEGAGLDGALHYSRRSAMTAMRLAAEHGSAGAFRRLTHYCLSADVAVPLVEAAVPAHFVAARPTEDALLAGLRDAPAERVSPRDGARC